ncbi:hypothetical protein STCU_10918 [Strigomonas culicis]|uniref:Uncharacterized protein n=1 Tax=Strigomonas culicis TaxID=28005 RepID=S9TJ51_9TRYP|nr:hypothetical protein STCU_10918 [Strigomonas culicis]|eukprot:EPY16899.1 hypothetical protein STCU_10918 [Strigomonas culicis]
MTARGIGSAPHVNPMVGSATFSMDARAILRQRLRQDPIEARCGRALPLFAVGYSVGCSMLLSTLAEEEAAHAQAPLLYPRGFPVTALVTMNAAYALEERAARMQSPLGRRLYQSALVRALRQFHQKYPDVMSAGIPNVPGLGPTMRRTTTGAPALQWRRTRRCSSRPTLATPQCRTTTGRATSCPSCVSCGTSRSSASPRATIRSLATRTACGKCRSWPTQARGPFFYIETPAGGHLGYLGTPWDELSGRPSFLVTFPLRCVLRYIHQTRQ